MTVTRGGLQHFSLKRLAIDAGVSEPLLFHYFSSRVALFQQLLVREYSQYVELMQDALENVRTLEDALNIYVARNYDHHDGDNVIDALLAEPDIAIVVEVERQAHLKYREKFLINIIAKELGIKRKKAAMLALMGSSASMAAAAFAHDNNARRNETVRTVIEFIIQGFESQRAN